MATALFRESLGLGCSHYMRRCRFLTPCCNKIYTCRICHDEEEDHILNRKAVKEVICMVCHEKQPVSANCFCCEVRFGEYVCLVCNLFDDKDKGQYHCFGCGLCRVGGELNFFHCEKCNMCLTLPMMDAHQCVENRAHADCPVCLENMHTSRTELYFPECGHLLHTTCVEELKKARILFCPICKGPLKKN